MKTREGRGEITRKKLHRGATTTLQHERQMSSGNWDKEEGVFIDSVLRRSLLKTDEYELLMTEGYETE